MSDVFTASKRSRIMSSIRSSGNRSTELRFIRLMRRCGVRGWRRGSKLFGRPDFVFSKSKVAVFIDGDFWHGNPKTHRVPFTNKKYWRQKIRQNRKRDILVNKTLRAMGWRVTRFWESALKDEEAVMAKLTFML